nr:hypothetical protein JVH1_2245 [Rhodococcus sp. JVH1]
MASRGADASTRRRTVTQTTLVDAERFRATSVGIFCFDTSMQ